MSSFGLPSDNGIARLADLPPARLATLARRDPSLYAQVHQILGYQAEERERTKYEDSLIEFMKRAWREVEPKPFSLNWHHAEIAQQLEQITYGNSRHLIINIPPRHTKTLLVNVFWPAWIWCQSEIAPLSGPQVKFLCVSYGAILSEKIALQMRRLVMGDWYQSLWGHRVRILADQQGRADFGNTAGGERLSSSIEGGLLGKGGDIQICFPYDEVIWTEAGPRQIGDVVRERLPIRVWSFNQDRQQVELRRLTGWHTNPGSVIVEIQTEDGGAVKCTPDHRIWTPSGWRPAQGLRPGDLVGYVCPCLSSADGFNREPIASVLAGQSSNRGVGTADISDLLLRKASVWVIDTTRAAIGLFARVVVDMLPCLATTNRIDRAYRDAKFCGEDAGRNARRKNGTHNLFGEFGGARFGLSYFEGAQRLGIIDVLRASAIGKVAQAIVGRIAVQVSNLLAGAWGADKGDSYERVDIPRFLNRTFAEDYARVALVDIGFHGEHPPPRYTGPSSGIGQAVGQAPNAAKGTDFVEPLPFWNGAPNLSFARVRSIRVVGHEKETFCVTVGSNHNMFAGRGQVLAANCDDPQTRKGADSEAERAASIQGMSDLSTRITDPRISAKVLIQQRLHQNDATDWAVKNWPADKVWLMFPARYEPDRACAWDHRDVRGELLWPQVWNNEELTKIENGLAALDGDVLSEYAISGQLQQNPISRGNSIISREDWKIWPEATPTVADLKYSSGGKGYIPLPRVSHVLVSLDTNMSERETADWTACVVIGVWHREVGLKQLATGYEMEIDDGEQPRAILMGGWRMRGKLNDDKIDPRTREPAGVVQRVIKTARQFGADRIVIENKTRGLDVKNEIERQLVDTPFHIQLFEPQKHGDKTARLYSVQPLFAQELVYAPGRYRLKEDNSGNPYLHVDDFEWFEDIAAEIEAVPRGTHDDYADAVSQGLLVLREDGYLALTREYIAQQMSLRIFRSRKATIRNSYGV